MTTWKSTNKVVHRPVQKGMVRKPAKTRICNFCKSDYGAYHFGDEVGKKIDWHPGAYCSMLCHDAALLAKPQTHA